MSVRIEQWSVVRSLDPYTPPELSKQYLHGLVYGYPERPEGAEVTTSAIIGWNAETGEVQCYSRSYKLGTVDPAYEAAFPDAEHRLVASLKGAGA